MTWAIRASPSCCRTRTDSSSVNRRPSAVAPHQVRRRFLYSVRPDLRSVSDLPAPLAASTLENPVNQLPELDDRDLGLTREAVEHLRQARNLLVMAGATKAAARVRFAISSANGAVRNAQCKSVRYLRTPR